MNRKLIWLVAGVLATGLIAAGCGDDDDDESSDTGTDAVALTQQEWAMQADAICSQGNQELDQVAQQEFGGSNQPPSQAQQQKFAEETVIPSIEQQINDVRALGTPEGDSGEVEEFLDQAQTDLDKAKQDPKQLTDAGNENPFAETTKLGDALGLKVCSQ